jgi:hypothetical protein
MRRLDMNSPVGAMKAEFVDDTVSSRGISCELLINKILYERPQILITPGVDDPCDDRESNSEAKAGD